MHLTEHIQGVPTLTSVVASSWRSHTTPPSLSLEQPARPVEGGRHPNGIAPHAPSNGAPATTSTGERPNVGVNYTVGGGVGDGAKDVSPRGSAVGVGVEHDGGGREQLERNECDDDDLTREMTRKWLQGFTAEDILRDKNLLRQQLEVRRGDI